MSEVLEGVKAQGETALQAFKARAEAADAKLKNLPARSDLPSNINESLVVELYSK